MLVEAMSIWTSRNPMRSGGIPRIMVAKSPVELKEEQDLPSIKALVKTRFENFELNVDTGCLVLELGLRKQIHRWQASIDPECLSCVRRNARSVA